MVPWYMAYIIVGTRHREREYNMAARAVVVTVTNNKRRTIKFAGAVRWIESDVGAVVYVCIYVRLCMVCIMYIYINSIMYMRIHAR